MLLQSKKTVLLSLILITCLLKKEIFLLLQSNKATQNTDIPTKLFKVNADIFVEVVFTSLNKYIKQTCFPIEFETSKYNSSSLKNSKSSKDNYIPVSILSNISSVYQKFVFKQMSEYLEVTIEI